MTARSQAEILARFREVADDDFLGFRREVLAAAMDRSTLRDAVPDYEPDEWEPIDIEPEARAYLTFAVGKIIDHRGISAGRSVKKLTEYAWLMGRDDVVDAMDDADYAQYGAPQVRAFAVGLGWPWPGEVSADDAAALERMAEGHPCEPGCDAGCGR